MDTIRKIRLGFCFCAAVLFAGTLAATSFVVDVTEAGSLHARLPESAQEREAIDHLVVTGSLNNSDFATLRTLVGLHELDLSGTTDLTTIPAEAFADRFLEKIVFPEFGLTTIGAGAFAGTHLISLTLPASLRTLGSFEGYEGNRGVFEGCPYLTEVVFPDGLEVIGARAFIDCGVFGGALVLPKGLRTIEASAFYNCTGLSGALSLPDGLHTLEHPTEKAPHGVFEGCSGFESLNLGLHLKLLGNAAFKGCAGLEGTLAFPAELTVIGDNSVTASGGVFEGCRKINHLQFTESLEEIGHRAFFGCEQLSETLDLPSKLHTIGNEAFTHCTGLHGRLTLPAALRTIGSRDSVGYGVFEDCPFSGLSFADDALLHTIGTRAFAGAHIAGDMLFPQSLEYIGEMAFYGNSLSSVTFPEGLTHVGDPTTAADCPHGVFEGNPIISVLFGDAVQYIGRRAFCEVPLEGDLLLPQSLEVVGAGAFYGCTGLTGNMALPDKLRLIEGLTPYVPFGVFEGTALTGFSIGRGSRLERIGERAFYGNVHMTGSLNLPHSLLYIGSAAFYGCKNIRGLLVLPGALRSIGSIATLDEDVLPGAFEGCIGLIAVKMPVHVDPTRHDTVGDRAFYGCIRLTDKIYAHKNTIIGRNPGVDFVRTTFHSAYVSPDGNDDNDGSSWQTSFRTLAKALTVAVNDDYDAIVRLREGVYNETASAPIYGRYLEIVGGYTGKEDPWGAPAGSRSLLQNDGGAALRITDAGKHTTLILDNLVVRGINAYSPLNVYAVGDSVHIAGLNLRQETDVIGKVTFSDTLRTLRKLTFSGDTLFLADARILPQESPYFQVETVAWKPGEAGRIDVSGGASDRFIVMAAPDIDNAFLADCSRSFDVYYDNRLVRPDLLVWENSPVGQVSFTFAPVTVTFAPILSSEIDSFWLVSPVKADTVRNAQGELVGFAIKAVYGGTLAFSLRMNDSGYLSAFPSVTFVDTVNAIPFYHAVLPFDRNELTGVYHYDFTAFSSGMMIAELASDDLLHVTVETQGDGLIVTGFEYGEAWVSPHNNFRFRITPPPDSYASIYINGSLLSIPSDADGGYTVNIFDITSDIHIVAERTDMPPASIVPTATASPVHAVAADGAITVTLTAATPQPVTIYTLSGRPVVTALITSTHRFPLPPALYILRTDSAKPLKFVLP